MGKKYKLPELPYKYGALSPHISGEQLKIHHDIHHKGYVDGANKILEKLERSRKKGECELDLGAELSALSFKIGGHVLHSLFWPNMCPEDEVEERPGGSLEDAIDREFGSLENFKNEFTKAAAGVQGSGWGALGYCKETERLVIMQIEKHNVNIAPAFPILMVVDVWEHAYYLDYKNKRGDFLKAFWKVVNWKEISKRHEELL